MFRQAFAGLAVCIVIVACAACSDTTDHQRDAAAYHPTAPVSRPAYEWELRRYLTETRHWPMIYGPDGQWQFQSIAPVYGAYRLVGDNVCTRQEGATVERCATLSIGPRGPSMSEWREFPDRRD